MADELIKLCPTGHLFLDFDQLVLMANQKDKQQ